MLSQSLGDDRTQVQQYLCLVCRWVSLLLLYEAIKQCTSEWTRLSQNRSIIAIRPAKSIDG